MRIPDYDREHLLFGLLFAASVRLQATGDRFFEEITARQWFLLAVLESFLSETTIHAQNDSNISTQESVILLAS